MAAATDYSADTLVAAAALLGSIGEARGGASAPRPGTLTGASQPDFPTRSAWTFGIDPELSRAAMRQDERKILLNNSNAVVRTKFSLTLNEKWLSFVYADVGAADSSLKWQGLVGIRGSHGVELLGGWRRVTYHFSPGNGLDFLDFDGPFLGATLAW